MKYFGHESDASNDYRLGNIIGKYSFDGTGLYWYCNERICKNLDPPKGVDCLLLDDLNGIASLFQREVSYIREILDYFVETGAYTKSGEYYQNLKLLHRLDRYSRKKAKDKGIDLDPKDTPEIIRSKMTAKYEELRLCTQKVHSVYTKGTQDVHKVEKVTDKRKEKENKNKNENIKLSTGGGLRTPLTAKPAAKAKKPENVGVSVEEFISGL